MPFNYGNNHIFPSTNAPDNRSAVSSESSSAKPNNKPVNLNFQITHPKYTMDNLILSDDVLDSLTTIICAHQCWKKVFFDWNLKSVLGDRQNLFVNLYGEPGTGKTMAAHAIAHSLNKDILCVNYAEIESKYVGETGKNLNELFRYAASSDVILFFDEADAFLSKRVTNMNNSTDVSVNQTRSVLLTLLNDYSGMVIFASNFIANYDAAFMRRIQYHVKFELPNAELRERLWKRYIPSEMPAQLNYKQIAEKYDKISGSDISNAVLSAALKAAKHNNAVVDQSLFEDAIISIQKSKEANQGYTVTSRPVTEEYAINQIKKTEEDKL